jgi:peptide/nickel transport system permease protein
MREEMDSPHTATEIARGVPYGRIFRRHVLRNAAPPMLAVVGLQIPALIAGAVVVEQAFNLGGLGSLLLNGASAHDYPIVQAIALLMVVVTVLTGVAVDVVHGVLDPRLTIGASR